MYSNCGILVLSCDKYADIWPVFFEFLFKHWNDCPYKIYLSSNTISFNNPKVKTVLSGTPKDWSTDTRSILQQIKEEYVIVILEDYFIYAHPDQALLNRAVNFMEKHQSVFMRLACFPEDHFIDYAYDTIPDEHPFVTTRKEARYRVNLQSGLWHKKSFYELIVPGESPWEFEHKATERSRADHRLYSGIAVTPDLRHVHGPIPYLCTALSRGVWMLDAIELCKKEGIALNTGQRPVETQWAYMKRRWYHRMPFGWRKYVDYLGSHLK